jgi:type II pantothenate kinase
MMIMGIDIGGTNTQAVLFDGKTLKAKCSVEGSEPRHAVKCYSHLARKSGKNVRVVLTGGGSRKVRRRDFPVPFRLVGEIKAIGKGGEYLSKRRSVFVTSIGTGTAFVSVKKGLARHLGGTGVGGGTIYGLSRLMLHKPVSEVEKLGRKGRGEMDLTVKDIVGSGIGRIPAKATASNFGKARGKLRKAEAAHSMLKMVGETVGAMSYFAAKTVSQEKNMLMCGRVALNGTVKKTMTDTVKLLGGHAQFPKNAEYCAAIGAALL